MIRAAIDLGSNSIHLVVARVTGPNSLATALDQSVLLGLGDAVDRDGRISSGDADRLGGALSSLLAAAGELGAARPIMLGTEPFRRAANGHAVAAGLERLAGTPMHVLTPREEGLLTLIGATSGAAVRVPTLVVDLGGGSSECIWAVPGAPQRVIGLNTGSASLTRRHATHDPPTGAEIASMRADAAQMFRAAIPAGDWGEASHAPASPIQAILVGGAVTNIAKLHPGMPRDHLSRDSLEDSLSIVRTVPAALLSERFGMNLRRASTMPGGLVLTQTLFERFGLETASVTQSSLREGAILVEHRAGPGWPAQLSELARGW